MAILWVVNWFHFDEPVSNELPSNSISLVQITEFDELCDTVIVGFHV